MIVKEQIKGKGWERTIFVMEPSDVKQASMKGFPRIEELDAIARPWRMESWFNMDTDTTVEQEYECPDAVQKLALKECDSLVHAALTRAANTVQWQAPITFRWSTHDRNSIVGQWHRLFYDIVKEVFYWLESLDELPAGDAYKSERARVYLELRDCLRDLG